MRVFVLGRLGVEVVERLHDGVVLQLARGIGHVEHDDERVGVGGLFERGAEGGDEAVRQVSHEADGVAEHDLEPAAQVPRAGARHERGEDAVVGVGAPLRKRIEQRALAGVGVAHEADGEAFGVALAHGAAFAFLHVRELAFELEPAALDQSAVDLELLLARASCAQAADAARAHDALEVVPHGAQARVGVFELGELDLELGLVAGGPTGEDVEDQLAAVEHLAFGHAFDRRDLRGAEVVVEDDRGGAEGLAELLELFDLALAHVGARDGALEALLELSHDDGAGLLGEGAQLAEGVGGVVGGIWQADGGEHGALGLDVDGGSFFAGGHAVLVAVAPGAYRGGEWIV